MQNSNTGGVVPITVSRTLLRLFAIFLIFNFELPFCYAAEVYLGLQAHGGNGQPLGVGVAPFETPPNDSESDALAKNVRSVMREDLLFSRLFSIVEGGPAPSTKLDSSAWNALTAQVVIGGVVKAEGSLVKVECRIYDVNSGKVLYGKEGSVAKNNYRRLAHLLADQLIYQLSGQPGVAHTRIAFINNQTRHKEIYLMDYDGANVRQLTSHKSITLLPKWAPDGKSIAYNSYRAGNPDAYILDVEAGAVRDLSTRQGLNTCPNWSPDGATLALTMSKGGDPELFLIDKGGKIIRRLTYSPGVDTSPTFSPNGQQIAFVSDRSGSPELYVMDVTGASTQRLTYGQWVDSPAWSPKGDLIAYERQRSQGRYDIWIIEPSGRNARQISEAGVRNEHPSWSPDGRFIAYTSDREGRNKICIMGVDGSAPHCVSSLGAESSTPTWGP